MISLSDSLSEILDNKVVDGLASVGVTTVGELLHYTPRRYVRQGQASKAEMPETGEYLTIVGRITKADLIPMKKRSGRFLKVTVADESRKYEASFFNPKFIQHRLKPGARVMMAGTVKFFRDTIQLSHPDWMVLPDGDSEVDRVVGSAMLTEMYAVEADLTSDDDAAGLLAQFDRPIIPLYPATRDIQTWDIWGAVRRVLAHRPDTADALSDAERKRRGLITTADALSRIHLPDTEDDITAASARLKFDEALAIQTVLAQRRLAGRNDSAPPCPHVPGGLEDGLLARLPFELTVGQVEVGAELGADLGRSQPMSRLLQGEVGSGKTLVSLLAMLRVVDNGHQCAILAPTEVLAAQHYRTIRTMLGDLAAGGELSAADGATQIALLTGSMKTKGKRQTLLDVVSGAAGIVIGTHALLEENVEFFDLGMVVVDEQHRFGVEQRDVLRGRGRDGAMPHFLVMTATPIPRTVAMTAFGDLDTSVLTELPRGRQPITTTVVPMGNVRWVDRVWSRAAEEIAAGRQVYVVCSRIGGDEVSDGRGTPAKGDSTAPQTVSVLDQYENLIAGPLGHLRIGLLHGRLPSDEKNAVMDEFGRGEIDILVATTVIEVGVDVPNATMMVIVDAERFGVSQLHQLRGRVGRGQHAGLCLLMTNTAPVSQGMQRLNAVAGSNDGFVLARVDLAQRREGDVLGSLQSGGTTSLRFLSLLDDVDVIADARELADEVVGADLTLIEHRPLADLVDAILVPHKIAYLDKS
ncbi:ATP-dependent DNA helicase RecG [Gordonia sp. ABSL49_1]|uniref:ATP-dependent DNA helicase RecG n=1 Tax=unclassified Gordonia (in: high G+C Gram-positive bacteria) TaxID=2657482 RepID=UPI001F0E27F3|nr:ATP-dependent DNA helicase RecG [Gordonia sp. ABSL49_1]MCH5643061.1 ATP-dependent DNA helicase RecG [Gordonia sp. ABSL49_1]